VGPNYEDLRFEAEGAIATIVIDRPDNGNMLRQQTTVELADALRRFRDDRELRVAILTGAGERFFCIGGEHEQVEGFDHSAVLPVVDVYELIDTVAKPIIAAVNGYAVGGGNVLQVVCDVAIAADSAVFRQVGPSVGSFDAGYGTWILEQQIGRRRAKEMWYFNRKYDASEALAMGLVNEVVPAAELIDLARQRAGELVERGPGAIAGLKTAFSARHAGVAGQARLAHDLLLTHYLRTEEAHELSESFRERRPPDQSRFNK
jgi:naphthoate synthase